MNDYTNASAPAMGAGASTGHRSGVTRRTVLTTAAWSVPVIALAVTAPMAAASGEPEPALKIDFFEASWENLQNLQYLRGYFQVTNEWNNDIQWPGTQIDVTSLELYFDVESIAVADPIEAITLEFDDPNSTVGTWTYTGTTTPQAGTTRFHFTWAGTLTPNTMTKTTVLEWHTRAGAVVVDGSGFDTLVYATLTYPDTNTVVLAQDTTGSI